MAKFSVSFKDCVIDNIIDANKQQFKTSDVCKYQNLSIVSFCKKNVDAPNFVKDGDDYIYMVALYQNKDYHELIKDYYLFTDLFFNPNKSLNTQARATAIFKTLYDNDYLKLLENVNEFKEYYKDNVKLKVKKY